MPTFIGVDLAWQSNKNHSGGAVLRGDQLGLTLHALSSGLKSLGDVEEFIRIHTGVDTVVAVDAPLIIENENGQRPCETEVSRRFGAAHAGAHTSNLRLYPNPLSVRLARDLESQGFAHCPEPYKRRTHGKWFFEVYPHPAHVVLFERTRIIKYKKGRVATRRNGLAEFRQSLETLKTPPLNENAELRDFVNTSLENLRGQALKQYEDILDAIFCAYLAAYFWVWGHTRCEMIGCRETGYIINPKPLVSESANAAFKD